VTRQVTRLAQPGSRALLTCLALLTFCWGLLGWLDLPHRAEAGFDTDGNSVVRRVQPGSPAESAGLLPGDAITHFDGVSAKDQASLARQPRKQPGGKHLLGIERSGESIKLSIEYRPLPAETLRLRLASFVVGLFFLMLPAATFLRHAHPATAVLAVMGIGLSLSFFDRPYIADFYLRASSLAITTLFVLIGVAALLQFLLTFPHRRAWLAQPMRRRLIYLPVFLLWLMYAWRFVFTPSGSSALSSFTQFLAGGVIGGYLLASLFLLLRNFSRTDKAQRKALALNWMLFGTLVGFIPGTVAQLTRAFSPHAHLPAQDFYFIALALIPLSWSWSASRRRELT